MINSHNLASLVSVWFVGKATLVSRHLFGLTHTVSGTDINAGMDLITLGICTLIKYCKKLITLPRGRKILGLNHLKH